ncbi:unnamed protein product, partial [Onchocerca flexuosa]|uniref:Uncharacterized protein n=1 Tax=Onchocerca flexuosa TaxID=387005 RepID=A0A183H4T8_9BILA
MYYYFAICSALSAIDLSAIAIAYELRALDRKLNIGRYPMVDYPEMYLLQYGYSSFYLRYNEVP